MNSGGTGEILTKDLERLDHRTRVEYDQVGGIGLPGESQH